MTVTMRSGQRVSESCSCSAIARPHVMLLMHHRHTPLQPLSPLSPIPPPLLTLPRGPSAHPILLRRRRPPRARGGSKRREDSVNINTANVHDSREAGDPGEREAREAKEGRKEGSKEGPPYIGLVRHVRSDSKDEPQRDSLSSRHETGRRAAAAIFAIFC